jgi:hypothetical protein
MRLEQIAYVASIYLQKIIQIYSYAEKVPVYSGIPI